MDSRTIFANNRKLLHGGLLVAVNSPAQDALRSIVHKRRVPIVLSLVYMYRRGGKRDQEACVHKGDGRRRRPGSDRAALHRTAESWTTPTPRYAAARDTHDLTGINHHQKKRACLLAWCIHVSPRLNTSHADDAGVPFNNNKAGVCVRTKARFP